jgi:hypothetical protein
LLSLAVCSNAKSFLLALSGPKSTAFSHSFDGPSVKIFLIISFLYSILVMLFFCQPFPHERTSAGKYRGIIDICHEMLHLILDSQIKFDYNVVIGV